MGVTPLPFASMAAFFADEVEFGQLCDVTVPDASPQDWAMVISHVVPRYPYRFSFLHEGSMEPVECPLPQDPGAAIALAGSERGPWPNLRFFVEGLEVIMHFFGPNSIELDVERAQVNQRRYLALAEMMVQIGDAINHNVFLTGESCGHHAALVYAVAERRFRVPLHGSVPGNPLRQQVMRAVVERLHPIRDQRGATLLPLLQALDGTIKQLERSHGELALQDALTPEDRRLMDQAWSLAASIASPAPGSGAEQYRQEYECQIAELAARSRGDGA